MHMHMYYESQWLRNRLDGRAADWLQNRLAGFPVFHSTKPARRFRSVENWKTVYSHGNCINIKHTEEYI